jgi:hypothetical protein
VPRARQRKRFDPRHDVGGEVVVDDHGQVEGLPEDPLHVDAVQRRRVHAQDRTPAVVVGPAVDGEADAGERDRGAVDRAPHRVLQPGEERVRGGGGHVGRDALERVDVPRHVDEADLRARAPDVDAQGQRGLDLLELSFVHDG